MILFCERHRIPGRDGAVLYLVAHLYEPTNNAKTGRIEQEVIVEVRSPENRHAKKGRVVDWATVVETAFDMRDEALREFGIEVTS